MRRPFAFIVGLLCAALLVFFIWPSPIDAVAFDPEPIPELSGPYQSNNELHALDKIYEGLCHECEDIAVRSDGAIYAGEIDGDILLLKGGLKSVVANTGGRPLGLDIDTLRDLLIIADAYKGLLALNSSGDITLLTRSSEGLDFKFVDDIEIGPDGLYYFSDASSKYNFNETLLDIFEHGGHGRLCSYDPVTKQTRTLLDGLQFANGIATSPDSSFVLVNETGLFCVRKYWLKGPHKGTDEIILGNMPGFPDGISRGSNGIYWLTIVNPRTLQLESLMSKPFLRELLAKVPAVMEVAVPPAYGFVLGIDADGTIKHNYQDNELKLLQITSVQEHNENLFFGSLIDDGIGVMNIIN